MVGAVGSWFRDRRRRGSTGSGEGFGCGLAMELCCLLVRAGRGDDFPASASRAERGINRSLWSNSLARYAYRRRDRRILVRLPGNWWRPGDNSRSHGSTGGAPASCPTGEPYPRTCPDDGSCRVGLLATGLVSFLVCSWQCDSGLWVGTDLGARLANQMREVALRRTAVGFIASMALYMAYKALA
jgi:hypothetical protein